MVENPTMKQEYPDHDSPTGTSAVVATPPKKKARVTFTDPFTHPESITPLKEPSTDPLDRIRQQIENVSGITTKLQDTISEANNIPDKQQRDSKRKAQMQFNRTMEKAPSRASRVEKMPEAVALKIRNNPQTKATYFDTWMRCERSWGMVTLMEQLSEVEKKSTLKVVRWLNPAQMLDHYKVDTIVSAIILESQADPSKWRPLVDAPHSTDPLCREYKCTIIDEESVEAEQIKQRIITLKAELEKKAAMHIVTQFHTKKQNNLEHTTGTNNQNEGAEAEKEKEQLRIRKREEARVQKDLLRQSDAGKAEEWIKGINKDLGIVNQYISKCLDVDSPMPKMIRDEYNLRWTTHKQVME